MTINEFIALTKALSDPQRVRAFMALRGGELCVCQIIELLGLAPSTVSKHMSVLRQAGLVESRKEERWMYYRLPEAGHAPVHSSMRWVTEALSTDDTMRIDQKTIATITRQNPSSLCKMQRGK
jgi:DNA-binding transcriptional ArsR family regulator